MKQLLTILCLVLLSSYSYSKEVLFSDLIERDGIVYKPTQPSTINICDFLTVCCRL